MKSKRGLASMSPEKRREICSKGGLSVPAEKRAFSVDPQLAKRAGKIGGEATKKRTTTTPTPTAPVEA
jgi:general stress protein YciG